MEAEQEHLLLLAPSSGLGGGIERYLSAVVEALESRAVIIKKEALWSEPTSTQRARKLRFVLRSLRSSWALRRSGGATRVVAAHPAFLWIALACRLMARAPECHVMFYGIDIWSASKLTRFLTRRVPTVRPVCISSFGAGAVSALRVGAVLRPGITRAWFETLVEAGDKSEVRAIPVLTVLRLEDWRTKGVPELLEASAGLSVAGVTAKPGLIIAGQAPVPRELEEAIRDAPHADLVVSPSDVELAALYADSRVLALATRTRTRGERTGEGFGMVLAEAQIAGCPVVAPTVGGSDDAYIDGFTGVKPLDEGVAALREVLHFLLTDSDRWNELSAAATLWARHTFDPDRYARSAKAAFFRS